ncbi:hypothetical protein [Formosa sp. PL04]|uniref:hypothetical protein n=1 Tax=Formosa sp. PL04 TaxID=3081755 RepID=UPI002980E965|nr:hypothetical protein [Formosa sp. PL04]MDW5287781.1 hypothetical protein [Formosa sp. PL04]
MKRLFLLLFVSVSFGAFAQNNINTYKYVIVPNTYSFLKESNQYEMNALTQFLLEKNGFNAVMEQDDIPADLNSNGCLGLRANVLNESSLFVTKLKVVLKDCKNQVVFESAIGDSKNKDYQKGYQEALREAFESFADINYVYEASSAEIAAPVVAANVATQVPAAATPVTQTTSAAVASNAVSQAVTPVSNVLYAQEIPNGYQLVDSSPKVVYKLKKTKLEHVYFVEGNQAIVHKSGDNWVIEFYDGDILKEEILNVKF